MTESPKYNASLEKLLIQDEFFDLTLYQKLYKSLGCEKARKPYKHICEILNDLVPVEKKHLAFWQDFFGQRTERLGGAKKIKLLFLVALSRMFGKNFIGLVLEAIEIYGIKKYLILLETYKNEPLADAVREVLNDELAHENDIVLKLSAKRINPERVRNFFLGFNDGLVEILGAISGFFAALQETTTVLVAAVMVAVAGAISMAAGVYVATSSESEMHAIERGRGRFLGKEPRIQDAHAEPIFSSLFVGVSYFAGAMIPILPIFFGAKHFIFSVGVGTLVMVFVSFILAFFSGMDVKKRIMLNLVMTGAAVAISYGIGSIVRNVLGAGI